MWDGSDGSRVECVGPESLRNENEVANADVPCVHRLDELGVPE
jgi:hypothetical protein